MKNFEDDMNENESDMSDAQRLAALTPAERAWFHARIAGALRIAHEHLSGKPAQVIESSLKSLRLPFIRIHT